MHRRQKSASKVTLLIILTRTLIYFMCLLQSEQPNRSKLSAHSGDGCYAFYFVNVFYFGIENIELIFRRFNLVKNIFLFDICFGMLDVFLSSYAMFSYSFLLHQLDIYNFLSRSVHFRHLLTVF